MISPCSSFTANICHHSHTMAELVCCFGRLLTGPATHIFWPAQHTRNQIFSFLISKTDTKLYSEVQWILRKLSITIVFTSRDMDVYLLFSTSTSRTLFCLMLEVCVF